MRKGTGPFSRHTGREVGLRITNLAPGESVVLITKHGEVRGSYTEAGSYPWPGAEPSYAFQKHAADVGFPTIVEVEHK